jgi:hypothetical protein
MLTASSVAHTGVDRKLSGICIRLTLQSSTIF